MFQLPTRMSVRCLSSSFSGALAKWYDAMDGLFCQQCNAFKPRCMHTLTGRRYGDISLSGRRCGHDNVIRGIIAIAARHGGVGHCYIRGGGVAGKKEWHQPEEHRAPKTNLKYYYKFYPITITSVIHTRYWAVYAWTLLYTCQVRTATDCWAFSQSFLSIGRGPFNPHLQGGFSFLRTREYLLHGAEIS